MDLTIKENQSKLLKQ